MTLRAFLALLLTTIVVVAATVVLLLSRTTGPAAREPGTTFLPALAANPESVQRIIMTRSGDKTTVRRLDDGRWVVEEFSSYPARDQQVRDVIAGLAQLQSLEPKTRKPELFGKLDVDEPTTSESRATRLELFAAGDKLLADIIVGKTKSALSGQESLYVRRPDEDRAWLVKGKVDAPYNRIGWVNNEVATIDLPRMKSARLNSPAQGPAIHVFKNNKDERDFTIEDMPADHEVKDIFGAEDIARVVQQLTFEDVRPADKLAIDTTGRPFAEFVTFDGLKIDLWLHEAEGKHWAALRAGTVQAAAPAAHGNAASPEPTPEKIAEEAKTLNDRFTPWVFALPSYELGNLRKTMDDLIQKKAEEKPEDKGATAQ